MKFASFLFFTLLLCSCTTTRSNLQQDKDANGSDAAVMNRVVKDLCGADVAVLGEPGHHGDGRVVEFKVRLMQRLVDECHFDTIFFESSFYEFLNFNNRIKNKQPVDVSMIADAVGKVWSVDAEFQPLLPFLFERAKQGKLLLYGVQDGASTVTGWYAQNEMPGVLSSYLSGDTKTRCEAALRTHFQWLYTESHEYGPADTAALLDCLNQIQAVLKSKPTPSIDSKEMMHTDMVASLIRSISRDQLGNDMTAMAADREQSMYMNYATIVSRLPKKAKIIIWMATVHSRKVATAGSYIPFGAYIHQNTKKSIVTIGFSALSGTYDVIHHDPKPLPTAPQDSLESMAFAGNDDEEKYYSLDDLKKAGLIPARVFGADFKTLHWDTMIDGLMVFRETRPPKLLDTSKK